LERLGKQLGISQWTDWYHVKTDDIERLGAYGVLKEHGNSLSLALISCFPHHNWQPWKFLQIPKRYWENVQNQRQFIEWLAQELLINDKEDWCRISLHQIQRVAPVTLFDKYTLAHVLATVYPHHSWHNMNFSQEEQQDILFRAVSSLFPDEGRSGISS
jgi:hypothetical protein